MRSTFIKINIFLGLTVLPTIYSFRVCLDRAKNIVRIEELRIVNEYNEKIVIF
jgi:hypothetical protein